MSDKPRLSERARRNVSWTIWLAAVAVFCFYDGPEKAGVCLLAAIAAQITDFVISPRPVDVRKARRKARVMAVAGVFGEPNDGGVEPAPEDAKTGA